jgi:hypothetical protein
LPTVIESRFLQTLALCLCAVSSLPVHGQGESSPHPEDKSRGVASPAVDAHKLVGIPFVSPGEPETREQIVEQIKNSILHRLPELTGYPKDFDSLKQHKAVALRYRGADINPFVPYLYQHKYIYPIVDYWGGEWDADSLEEAKAEALKQCGVGGGSCVLFLEDESVLVSDKMVSDYIGARDKFVSEQVAKLKAADMVVLVQRAAKLSVSASLPSADQFSPPSNKPLEVGYPDWQQDYASACQDRIFYALLPLGTQDAEETQNNLSRVNQTGIYGAYDRRVSTPDYATEDFTTPDKDHLTEHMARFTRRYEFTSDAVSAKRVTLPENLRDVLAGQVIKEIWIEGSVRITHDNLPLIFDQYVAPVALRTDRGLYLGVQVKMPSEGFGDCYVGKPFSGKVLELAGAVSKPDYAKKALSTLLSSIQSTFSAEPIAADLIVTETFGPGEFGMNREHKPSYLLGAPYYESSTYTIETWAAEEDNPFGSLYGRESFKGARSDHLQRADQIYFFLKVSHVHTRAVHKNDTYSDPSIVEIEKIDDGVNKATTRALTSACSSLKGTFDGAMCKINQPF